MIPRETTWKLASVTILFLSNFSRNTVRNFVVKKEPSFSFYQFVFSQLHWGWEREKLTYVVFFMAPTVFIYHGEKKLYGV